MTIVVQIGKPHGVSLLQMAKTSGGSHVLEIPALCIAKHSVGDDGRETWVTRAAIKIEPAIIIEVTEIAAHGKENVVQMTGLGYIGKRAVMVVMVKFGSRSLVGQAQVIGRHFADVLDVVAGNEQIFPTIVVKVEEPRRKAQFWFGHTRPRGNLAEFPMAGSLRAIVMKQLVGIAKNRQIEVRASVMIVVGAGNALNECLDVQAASGGAFGERPIMVVMKKLAGIRVVAMR